MRYIWRPLSCGQTSDRIRTNKFLKFRTLLRAGVKMRISLFLNPKSMLYQKSKILSMIPISLVLSLVNFRHKYHHNRSEKWFKWFKIFIDVQIRLVKVYFNIPSVQILRDSIFINRRRFLNATFRIATIFGSKNVVCFKKKAHTSFIMKVTSFLPQDHLFTR